MTTVLERLGRRALHRAGFETTWAHTVAGPVHLYVAQGRGSLPPVVAFHGINSSVVPFGRLLDALRPSMRAVIAPDAPGHGFSPLPADPLTVDSVYAGIRDAARKQLQLFSADGAPVKPIIMGNSLGGAMAARYAMEHPDQIAALVLTSPAGAPTPAEEFEEFLERFNTATRHQARAFVARLYDTTPLYARLLAPHIGRQLQRPQIRQILDAVEHSDQVDGEALAALSAPVLFWWGRGEKLMLPSHRQWYLDHLPPHAEVIEPRGVGHLPHMEAPKKLAATITDFARRRLAD